MSPAPRRAKPATTRRVRPQPAAPPLQIDSLAATEGDALARAISAYGRPTKRSCDRFYCQATWRDVGLTLSVYAGGSRRNRFVRALISGSRWQAATGVRVGDTLDRLRSRYPDAGPPAAGWWPLEQVPPAELGRGPTRPRLMARVRGGRVVVFEVNA